MMKRLDENLPESTVGGVYRPLVVHVVRQFWPNRGGLEDVVLNLCRQALRRGYRIRVVTLNSLFSDPSIVLADREMVDGIEVVRIPWKGTSRYPVAPSVLQHIDDADLVHVHAIDFFFDFLAATKLLHGRKMIATTHGGFFHTKRFAAIKAVWFQTLTRFSASRYRFVVGCSQSDVDTFRPIVSRNLEMIENGADTLKFYGLAPTTPAKRLISIGRFSLNKRLDRLVAMVRALVAIDPDWSLDLVGVQSDLSVAEVKALTTGIETNVHVHAGLSNAEVGGLVAENSIFVSASDYEGFGLVAIEAMSAGLLPVLETNSAYEALAKKHKSIRLGDFSDAGRAAKTVMDAWTSLEADPAGLRCAVLAAADQYSWDEVSKRYFHLYDIALSRNVTQTA
jgi:alpha-1,3-mannosyltransferase